MFKAELATNDWETKTKNIEPTQQCSRWQSTPSKNLEDVSSLQNDLSKDAQNDF